MKGSKLASMNVGKKVKNNFNGVGDYPREGGNFKNLHPHVKNDPLRKDYFAGSGAKGKETVVEARGKHLL